MTYRESAIEFLWRSALTDQSKALASLQLLLDHGTGYLRLLTLRIDLRL